MPMPVPPWEQGYISLALRLDAHVRSQGAGWFVEYYLGPESWRAEAVANPGEPTSLLRAAAGLLDTLPEQGFERARSAYLSKQLIAMETVCRKLAGEPLSLEDEVRRCFDLEPAWLPEAQVAAAHAMLDRALPGTGHPADRLAAWRAERELPLSKRKLAETILRRVLAEARTRTRALVALPDEDVDLRLITGQAYGAANWYLGGYRSRMEFNLDLPLSLGGVIDLVCHEGYPGHHTEFTLKERHLLVERGHAERLIYPVLTPQLTISEGLATLASELVFAPGEREAWLSEHIYPFVGLEVEPADLALVNRANALMDGVRNNAVFLLAEGRGDEEAIAYLIDQAWMPEDRARKFLTYLRLPFMAAYNFTYHGGAELLRPWLQGAEAPEALRRILCEPTTPSDWANRAQAPLS